MGLKLEPYMEFVDGDGSKHMIYRVFSFCFAPETRIVEAIRAGGMKMETSRVVMVDVTNGREDILVDMRMSSQISEDVEWINQIFVAAAASVKEADKYGYVNILTIYFDGESGTGITLTSIYQRDIPHFIDHPEEIKDETFIPYIVLEIAHRIIKEELSDAVEM